jgi:hypothetical protein
MKITRRHLRRIIREELILEQMSAGPAIDSGGGGTTGTPDAQTEERCCAKWTNKTGEWRKARDATREAERDPESHHTRVKYFRDREKELLDKIPKKFAPHGPSGDWWVDKCGNNRGEPVYDSDGTFLYSCTWSRGPDVDLVDRIVDFAAEEVFPDFMEIAIATPKWLLDTTVDMVVETSKDLLIVGTVMATRGAVLKTGAITPEQYVQSLLNLAVFVLLWYGGPVAFRVAGNVLFSAPSTATSRMAGEAVENLVWARANTYSDDVIRGSSDAVKHTAKTMDDAITASRSPAAGSPSQRTAASPDKPAASVESQTVDEIIQSQKSIARQEAKDEFTRRAKEASDELIDDEFYWFGTRPPGTKRAGWEDAIKVPATASRSVPEVAYPAFAKKLLVRIAQSIERSSADDIMLLYPDVIDITGGSTNSFTVRQMHSFWNKIPGNPAGKGLKDFEASYVGFEIRNVLSREEVEALAREMFDQFPAMSRAYEGPAQLVDDVYNLVVYVGHSSTASGKATRVGVDDQGIIRLTPFDTRSEFSQALRDATSIRTFITDQMDRSASTWAHEFDHWLRMKVVKKTGGTFQKADYYDADGNIISEKWLAKWIEFEADFTSAQFSLLDLIGSKGATPDVVRILTSPVEFEKYFLAMMADLGHVDWGSPVSNQLLQRVRGRLFNTENGLYWALRRALGIEAPPRAPLPENIQINLRRWSTLAGII